MRLTMACMTVAMLAAPTAASAQDAAIRALVVRFESARLQYDATALSTTLAPDYEEISPIGDVDTRDKVLSFYTPETKKPTPQMTNDEIVVHMMGKTALLTERTSFTAPGMTAPRSIRARYVARRIGRAWNLVSAQYTPIPPPRTR